MNPRDKAGNTEEEERLVQLLIVTELKSNFTVDLSVDWNC